MSVFEIIRKRQSTRKYIDKPVEDDKLDMLLEAARLAPSSGNSQPWHFIIVKNKDIIKKIVYSVPLGITVINKFMENVPVVIVGCVKPGFIQRVTALFQRENHIIDISIAMEHIVLVAEELGLGTCWIGWFDEKRIKKLLKVPFGSRVIAMLTLGYPAEGATHATTRKSLREIYSVDQY